MAVLTGVASTTGWGGTSSVYGSVPWSPGSSNVVAVIPISQGTNWIVWKVQIPGQTAGQAFNGIRLQGVNDFTVGGGGVGKTRQATLYVAMGHALTDFLSAGAGAAMQTLVGTGTGNSMNFVYQPSGFTTDDINNGTMFFGVAASTNSGDSGQGDGTLRYSAISFSLYTAADVPNPAPSQVSASLSNPSGNWSVPGVLPGQQFAAVSCTLASPIPTTFFNMQFTLPTGLTFASNGSGTLTLAKGTGNDAGNPYNGATGLINIAATVKPGTYNLICFIQGISVNPSYSISTQLLVAARRAGLFFEV